MEEVNFAFSFIIFHVMDLYIQPSAPLHKALIIVLSSDIVSCNCYNKIMSLL